MNGNIILQFPLPDFISLIKSTVREVMSEKHVETEHMLTSEQVMKLLNISRPTLLKWRSEGKVPFIKHGNKIIYNNAEIMKALKKN